VKTLDIQIMKPEEQAYTYSQSQQISMQTGCIGHLRADMDSGGEGFFSSWNDFRKDLKTQEFKDELDTVINELREDGNLLCNRTALSKYCYSHPESSFGNEREFGIRVNTEKYAYMMRLNPNKGEYQLYCYCYRKDWLDSHIEQAQRGIRFIDSSYNELFKIKDGEQITVTSSWGDKHDYTCRYIDDYHTEVGNNLYHICEFAERMEQGGCTYAPMEPPLPPMCYSILPSTGEVVQIDRWQKGYTATSFNDGNRAENEAIKDKFNEKLGVSKAQEQAMLAGSMIRWDSIAAKPKSYDENGKAIKPKDYER